MTDKTKSKTFQKIIGQQVIKDILNQPNVTFKNKKGNDKQRHGGLTIKFSNDIDVNDKVSKVVVNDKLKNNTISNINKVSVTEILTKEIGTQTETIEEKSTDNFSKYTYNSVTILEDKKITKLRKKIYNELIPELDKKTNDKNQLLSSQDIITSDISKIKKELLESRNNLIEEKMMININERIINQKITNNEIRKVSDLEIDIGKKEKQIKELEKNKKIQAKQMAKLKKQNKEKENKINKIKAKLNKYDNRLNIPSAKPDSWFNKSDFKIKLEKNMASSTSRKEKEKISKKISQLDEEMIKIWNSKKVDKIYEEILAIEDKIIFITTLIHIDNSIREQILFFQELTNGNIEVIKQNKQYENIYEYKKDISLIENTLTNKNNISFSKMPIKKFLKQHNDFKLKPTKTENILWLTSILLPIIAIIIGIFHPPALIVGCIGLAIKTCTSFFYPKTKKVESWWFNKIFNNIEKKEKDKKEFELISKNLINDKLETKLQAQYDILKQELNLNKNKNVSELISSTIMKHKSNNLLENSIIEAKNTQDFDSIIKKSVNHQDPQPSTSTEISHSNSRL